MLRCLINCRIITIIIIMSSSLVLTDTADDIAEVEWTFLHHKEQ